MHHDISTQTDESTEGWQFYIFPALYIVTIEYEEKDTQLNYQLKALTDKCGTGKYV